MFHYVVVLSRWSDPGRNTQFVATVTLSIKTNSFQLNASAIAFSGWARVSADGSDWELVEEFNMCQFIHFISK